MATSLSFSAPTTVTSWSSTPCSSIPGDLETRKTAFFLCDVQERFRAAILNFDAVVENSRRLATTSKLLHIPLVVTEQYPKGLGKTVEEIDIGHAVGVYEKTKFSMVIPEVEEVMKNGLCQEGLKQVVLFGVEAHVCVQQTAIDLLKKGLEVVVVADASSSRSSADRLLSFDRLRGVGAVVTSTEAVLFQLIQDKNHEKFKEIQALVKSLPPDAGLCKL